MSRVLIPKLLRGQLLFPLPATGKHYPNNYWRLTELLFDDENFFPWFIGWRWNKYQTQQAWSFSFCFINEPLEFKNCHDKIVFHLICSCHDWLKHSVCGLLAQTCLILGCYSWDVSTPDERDHFPHSKVSCLIQLLALIKSLPGWSQIQLWYHWCLTINELFNTEFKHCNFISVLGSEIDFFLIVLLCFSCISVGKWIAVVFDFLIEVRASLADGNPEIS